MELRVESVEGFSMPPGAYVGVRIGEVLKQGRYEPQRCYHFPVLERRRNAKIDVFRHVGSCVVSVDPDQVKMTSDVRVASSDPTVAEMMLKVNIRAAVAETATQKEAKAKAAKSQAKDYLSKYHIEEKLSEAVKALLKEQPNDPMAFLCRHLSADEPEATRAAPTARSVPVRAKSAPMDATLVPFKGYYKANVLPSAGLPYMKSLHAKFSRAVPETKGTATGTQAQPPKNMTIDGLRNQARDVLFKASLDGNLNKTLADVQADIRAASGTTAPQDAATIFRTTPSVGTWLAKSSRQIDTTPKSNNTSFVRMASVGTWCVPRLPEQDM